ncbi:hypothetical protein FB567DRAFT_81910 [Paraphoma chrysanthemicola]|uniref:Uncharacterized protein n=1 Tax=Paraphoma chrysanthemicola TaxID=798071 RepID=A0A8K0VWU2_9PLEO|nr:hypothetical protein FB567DRAFT_81910 [Paraphoma chrysanthemicola]
MKAIGNGRNVYARYANMAKFISLIQRFPLLAQNTKEICLVKDGLQEHLYRSEWAWEAQMYKENWKFTEEDGAIIRKIAGDHETEMFEHAAHFYNGGGYRAMLTQLLRLLPNVTKLYVRKLSSGEHIAGWSDTDKLKQLSVYKPELDSFIYSVYYGDWQYDTVHLRKTHYIDEWGNNVIEPNAGPQASFRDDFAAARVASGFAGQVIRL